MKTIRKTERLIIREYKIEDAPFIFALLNSPGWIEHIGDRKIYKLEDAEQYLSEKLIPNYLKHGYGFYMLELKKDNTPIGMNGLSHRPGLDHIDIGYALLPAYYGKGYAYESSIAILDHAKNDLKLKKLLAITTPENQKSINVLTRIGMSYVEQIKLPKIEGINNLYSLDL